MSIFENDRSENEPWLQEHKKHFQSPKTDYQEQTSSWAPPKKERRRPRPNPIRVSGVMKKCQHCQTKAPMESFRAGKCLACQVADYLGPTP